MNLKPLAEARALPMLLGSDRRTFSVLLVPIASHLDSLQPIQAIRSRPHSFPLSGLSESRKNVSADF